MDQAATTTTSGKFSLRTLLLAVTAFCLVAGVSHYLGVELVLGIILLIAAWVNLVVIGALVVGVVHGSADVNAACIGAVIPMAALTFATFTSGRHVGIFIVGYMTSFVGAYVCRRVRRRLSDSTLSP